MMSSRESLQTIEQTLTVAQARLIRVSDTPHLDAQVLLAFITGKPRAWLLAHPEARLEPAQSRLFAESLTRLEQGEPLPYILGSWEFYGMDFTVTPDVLIPRPETELLVETASGWLQSHPDTRLAADVGTGSGIIAISLAAQFPDLTVIATDISFPALQVAHHNASRHGVSDHIHFVQSDLLSPFHSTPDRKPLPRSRAQAAPLFGLICANLPYIPGETLQTLKVARWEPSLALYGGPDGLDVVRELLEQAPTRLAPGGLLLLEIEADQGEAARALAQTAFPASKVRMLKDLAGKDRLVAVQTSYRVPIL